MYCTELKYVKKWNRKSALEYVTIMSSFDATTHNREFFVNMRRSRKSMEILRLDILETFDFAKKSLLFTIHSTRYYSDAKTSVVIHENCVS